MAADRFRLAKHDMSKGQNGGAIIESKVVSSDPVVDFRLSNGGFRGRFVRTIQGRIFRCMYLLCAGVS